jgi:hypothetical protein
VRPAEAVVEESLGVLGRDKGLTLARLLSCSSSASGSSLAALLLLVVVVVDFLVRAGVPVGGALPRLSSWARRSSSVMDFFWAILGMWSRIDMRRIRRTLDVVGGAVATNDLVSDWYARSSCILVVVSRVWVYRHEIPNASLTNNTKI